MPIKILVTGDNHLNYYSQRLGGRLAERRQRIGAAWEKTIDYAIDNNVDLYLHTGDLFDQISPRNSPRASVVEGFRRLKEAGVRPFVIAGNHEAPGSMAEGASPHAVLREAGLATVFEDTMKFGSEVVEVGGIKVSVAGIAYNQRLPPSCDPIEGIRIPGGDGLNIAMMHCGVEGAAAPIWEEPLLRLASLQKNPHIHLFAVGHIHKHYETRIGDSLLLVPGATERFDFGEVDNETGFSVVEADGTRLKTGFIKTEAQSMRRQTLHMSGFPKVDRNKAIREVIAKAGNKDGLLQIVLEGELPFDEYAALDFTGFFDEGVRGNFYFEYVDRIGVKVPGLELQTSGGLHPRKELADLAHMETEKAAPEQRGVWERATALALEAYDASEEE